MRVESATTTIKDIEAVFKSFPVKKPTTAKEKKAALEKQKALEEELAELAKLPKLETMEEALSRAEGWKNSVAIH